MHEISRNNYSNNYLWWLLVMKVMMASTRPQLYYFANVTKGILECLLLNVFTYLSNEQYLFDHPVKILAQSGLVINYCSRLNEKVL